MHLPLDRRALLARGGLAGLAALGATSPVLRAAALRRRDDGLVARARLLCDTACGPLPAGAPASARGDLGDVGNVLATWVREGLAADELEATVQLAAALALPATSQVPGLPEALHRVAQSLPADQRLRAPLLAAVLFKHAQEEAEAASLPPAPDVAAPTDARAAELALDEALAAGEADGLERALLAADGLVEHADLFEPLWPAMLRADAVSAVAIERALARLSRAELRAPVLRRLARLLCSGGGHEELSLCRAKANALPDGRQRRQDMARSVQLARELSGATAEGALSLVEAEWNRGVTDGSIWDGLRLFAHDLFARAPGDVTARAVALSAAGGTAYEVARTHGNRMLAMLHTAVALSALEAEARKGGVPLSEERTLEALYLPKGERQPLKDLLLEPDPAALRATAGNELAQRVLSEALAVNLLRAGASTPQALYLAGLSQDVERCHARWRPVLLASAMRYLPSGSTPASPLGARLAELVPA